MHMTENTHGKHIKEGDDTFITVLHLTVTCYTPTMHKPQCHKMRVTNTFITIPSLL